MLNTVVNPVSTNFGVLSSAKWSPGMMFISWAASQRLCCRSIFFVTFPVHPSGNIIVFMDGCLVSSKSGWSSSGAAPKVAPESKKANLLDFLLCNFCTQCTATLLVGPPFAIADRALSALV